MRAFISHNKADRLTARLLAVAIVEQGGDVWFDEWSLRPGDSITGGIEGGLSSADTFILLWSASAQQSHWVGTEIRAYIHRRVENRSLRIVPVMLDETPLPVLIADYKGFRLTEDMSLTEIAAELLEQPVDQEIARILQTRLLELLGDKYQGHDPLPYVVCPECGSPDLHRSSAYSIHGHYVSIECKQCHWSEGGEVP